MTISSNDSQTQHSDPLTSLYAHPFALLSTFRKSGEAVPTTVWFAPDDSGHLYITTQKSSGKIKRIRNNEQITLVPSDVRGAILDGQPPVNGRAREVSAEEHAHAEEALKRKYGAEYETFMARMGSNSSTRTFIEIVASAGSK